MSIGTNIQLARKLNNMTQKELANKINKTEASVKKYESDSTNVPVNVLEDIANVFNVSREVLIGSEIKLKLHLVMKSESDDDIYVEDVQKDYHDEIRSYFLRTLNKYADADITKKSTKYEIHHDKPLSQKDKLNHALEQLITYANKNTSVELTEREHDILFDEVADYIRYKLYSMGK